ncbi:Ras-related GTP-binding protein C/D, partial [Tremellales sp. Uapishka_1]
MPFATPRCEILVPGSSLGQVQPNPFTFLRNCPCNMSNGLPPTAGEPSRSRTHSTDDSKREKILVLGWRKAGKTSCIKTVFQQVAVKDVPYFGITQKIEKINYDSIVPLQIWDTPSNFELDQLDVPLNAFSTVVYVMDMQQDDSYHEAIIKFVNIMLRAYLANPFIKFAVFIHKAEVLSEDYRGGEDVVDVVVTEVLILSTENYREIQRAMQEELEDFRYSSLQNLTSTFDLSDTSVTMQIQNHLTSEIRFDMTSVHDVSLRDAWSKVIQGIMEMLPDVEALLLNFTGTSGMENCYLFDINSGVILATDNRQRNDATIEQVTVFLSRFLQFRDLYKDLKQTPRSLPNGTDHTNDNSTGDDADELAAEAYGGDDEEDEAQSGWWDEEDPEAEWMSQSTRLLPNTTIALWQFTPHLALVVLLKTDIWQARRGMIEYNLTFLRQGVRRILMEI